MTKLIPILLMVCGISIEVECMQCQAENLRKLLPEISMIPQSSSDMVFYGLTQDCQLFFARPDQLHQLESFRVQTQVTYCLPNLVQLHWRQFHHHGLDGAQMGLQLLFKRANNQICTLPIEFPSKNALSGFTIFSYSILSSLNYAACSYIPNSSFIMEPDLSFMDSTYSDVIYFADPASSGSFWNIRQFKFDKNGYFKSLESFIVKNFAEDKQHQMIHARDYIISLDNQRHKVYAIQRLNKKITSTCAYDLLFRPSKLKTTTDDPLQHDSSQYRVNSFAAEGNHLLIGNSFRQNQDQFLTKLFLVERDKRSATECLLELRFLVKVGLISMETKETLEKVHLPHFGHHKTHKPHQGTNSSSITSKPLSMPTKSTPRENGFTRASTRTFVHVTTTPKAITSNPTEQVRDLSDVGDGRLLGNEENKHKKPDEARETDDSEDEELGFMTEITTKNGIAETPNEIPEGSGEIPFASNETNSENLSSSADLVRFYIPVILAFVFIILKV